MADSTISLKFDNVLIKSKDKNPWKAWMDISSNLPSGIIIYKALLAWKHLLVSF
jgi:hypothetical protein